MGAAPSDPEDRVLAPGATLRLVKRAAPVAAGTGAAIVLWWLLVTGLNVPDYLLPPPSQVVDVFRESPGYLLSNSWVTIVEIVLGLGVAILFSVLWATLLVSVDVLRRAFLPLLVAAQSAPKEAMAPIFIIWWGFSPLPKVAMAALVSFFPMLVATVVGLERFTDQHRLLAASMGAGPFQTFFKFRIWTALPSFLGGVRLGVTLAVIGAVLGEYLGSDKGVGYVILGSSRRLDGGLLYASLILLIVISWGLVALVDLLENRLLKGARAGRFVS
jgi:NitT/TauT family transport system permease protein